MTNKLRIERLPNGLIRLFDYACQWYVCYDQNGNWQHGGTDSQEYRKAIRQFLGL